MKPYYPILLFSFLLICTTGLAQEAEPNIYVDSTGQIYVRADAPIYFFIADENNTAEKTLLPCPDEKSNPMYFDGDGNHFLQYNSNGKNIKYMIIADGKSPKPRIKTKNGLLFARKTRIYANGDALFIPQASDQRAGVKKIFTAINGGSFNLVNGSFSLEKQGENEVKIFAIDNVGNTSDTIAYSIILSPEVVFKIDDIHFETGSSKIIEESNSKLLEILEIMLNYPELILQIDAHADTRGNSESNLALSQRRANSVISFLANKGISNNRLKAKGYGDTKPINECIKGVKCTETQHRVNRRVEFRFMLPK